MYFTVLKLALYACQESTPIKSGYAHFFLAYLEGGGGNYWNTPVGIVVVSKYILTRIEILLFVSRSCVYIRTQTVIGLRFGRLSRARICPLDDDRVTAASYKVGRGAIIKSRNRRQIIRLVGQRFEFNLETIIQTVWR